MVATGFALLFRQLRYSHDAFAFTFFFALGDLGYALFRAHSCSGVSLGPGARPGSIPGGPTQAGYATVIAFPIAVLLLGYDFSATACVQSAPVPSQERLS